MSASNTVAGRFDRRQEADSEASIAGVGNQSRAASNAARLPQIGKGSVQTVDYAAERGSTGSLAEAGSPNTRTMVA